MKFYSWMRRNYSRDASAKGELFKIIKGDDSDYLYKWEAATHKVKKFRPESYISGHNVMLLRLSRLHIEQKYIDAFEECWKEYLESERVLRCR